MEVSIVIPIYNEENSIENTISEIKKVLENKDIKYEIIAVNDGSTDNTSIILKKIPDIKIVENKTNKGYGFSLKKGIKNAKYENIFITDADGTYPNDKMPEFIKYFYENNLDMLVGKRNRANIPLIRKPAKFILKAFANYVSGFKIPDLNSGFRIFKKDLCIEFFNILPDGFSFTTTITLAMFSKNYFVEYLPIDYYKRDGKSKIRPIQDTFNFFNLIWKTVFYFSPLKIFLPLSFIIFLAGWGVFFYSYFYTEKVMDITTIVLLLTSVQIFALGLVADLIVKRG